MAPCLAHGRVSGEFLNHISIGLEHHGRLTVKCECYAYLLIYVYDKWQHLLSVIYYLYHEVHWFCFSVAQPLHYIFFPQVQKCWSLLSYLLPYAHLCEVMKCHFIVIHMELSRVYLYL